MVQQLSVVWMTVNAKQEKEHESQRLLAAKR